MLKTVLIDLSGTLHIENTAISGAVEALQKLLDTNVRVKFVTNTTKESRNFLHNRLTNLGFPVRKEDIYSSLAAARALIVAQRLKPMLLVSPEAKEDFEGLIDENEVPNAVVIGLAPTEFNYDNLNIAFRHIQNGAQIIAIHAGKYYKRGDGLALGPGCFVKGLEYATEQSAVVVGKPSKEFFHSALDHGMSPHDAIMIGDDVVDDIQGALNAGMRAFLVQTGKYRPNDETKINPPPTKVFPSFVEAVDAIIDELKTKT